MSMMKFDDSKIKEIRKRKEQGLPPLPTDGDVVEQSKNAKGGSELIYQRVKERVPDDLWNYFQVILSRVREYEDKPKILWFQDTSKDPEVQFLKEKSHRDKFERFVFPSDWSLEKYNIDLGVEYEKSVVLKNAIVPIPVHTKPKDGPIRLAYTSTPHRGLDVLIGAFKALKLENVELDIYSSFKIYGWEAQDKEWEPLYEACKETPNVNYHGTVSNEEIRSALQQDSFLSLSENIIDIEVLNSTNLTQKILVLEKVEDGKPKRGQVEISFDVPERVAFLLHHVDQDFFKRLLSVVGDRYLENFPYERFVHLPEGIKPEIKKNKLVEQYPCLIQLLAHSGTRLSNTERSRPISLESSCRKASK